MSALEKGIACTEQLGCPAPLLRAIHSFVEMIVHCLAEQNVGVLLVGSASRGELSWEFVGDKLQMFSDVEFLIAVDRLNHDKHTIIADNVQQIEKKFDFGVFFHIDFTFIEWRQLGKLDTKFFVFESKQCGIEFCDRPVASRLPETSLDNLNWKELNEILLHRLSSIVRALPAGVFVRDLSAEDNQRLSLNLAKNSLDITTWLHPYEADRLVAGYGNRLEYWARDRIEKLALSAYFSNNDVAYLRKCLMLRRSPSSQVSAIHMLGRTMDLYGKAIRYCKHMNGLPDSARLEDVRVSSTLFDEYRLRRRLSQAVSILRRANAFGLKRLVLNVLGAHRGLVVKICDALISIVVRYDSDENNARQSILEARTELTRLIRARDVDEANFENVWVDTLNLLFKYQEITQNH